MLSLRATIIGLCLGAALYGTASAAPITYTVSASFAGSLNGNPFSGPGTIIGTSDTDDVIINPARQVTALETVSFSFAGVGSGTITTSLQVESVDVGLGLDKANPTPGQPPQLFNVQNSTGTVLDIRTPFSITGPTFGVTGQPIDTSAGVLRFLVPSQDATFTGALTATPEPASLSLLLAGVTALGLSRRLGRIT